jgi:hypothetical protein
MKNRSRRRFLGESLAGIAGAGIVAAGAPADAAARSQDRVAGANRRVRVGLIGAGGMGTGDLRDFLKSGTQVVAICDVDDAQAAKAREMASKDFGQSPELVTRDFRAVLDRKDIDADRRHARSLARAADDHGVRGR